MSPAVVMGCIKWLLPAVHRRPGSVHVGKVCADVTDDTVYLNSSAATKKPGGLLHTSRCPSVGSPRDPLGNEYINRRDS